MKKKALAGKVLSGVLLFGTLAPAQEADGPNEKAKRYHTLLLKRPGNATVFSRFVNAWLDTGDKKEMKTWLEESAKAGGAAEWRVLAAFHEYLGEDEAALDALNQAVEKDEKAAPLRLARAKLHAKLLNFEAALADLEVATADEKLGVEASKLQGIYLARAGRIEEAVAAWKKVIERFPKDEELREDLIEVEVAEGLYQDAIAASQALVAMTKDPYKKALRQLRLGDIQILGNEREEGLKTYETIMAATGADTWLEREVLAQVERVFMRDDNIQGLRDFFQKLREAHPRRVSVRKALARQMALNGEMDEAIALFKEVLKITPGDIGNREEFIAFLETNERWKEAKEELAELLKLRENDPLLWERMAGIEKKNKDPEGVKAALAKVRDLKKGTPEGLIAVAALYTQAELLTEAEALLREGQGTFAESDEVTEALASFLMQNAKEKEALAIWTEMAKSADREGLLRVARSLTGHGKSGEAFKLLQTRMEEFGQDPLILAQFCNLAFDEEEAEVALPFGLELVRQSKSPTELEAAIKTANRVVRKAGKLDEILKQLEGNPEATISEQCLISDLYATQGDTLKALEVLTAAEKADEGLLARFYRVRFDESRGELELAIASLRKIIKLPEGRKTVHVRRLVGLLERSGDLPGALTAVDDWKRMAPGDQAAWTRRSELLSANGEPDQAVLELRRMIGKFGAEEDSRAKLAAALLEANEHRSAQRIYEQLYEEGDELGAKLKWVGELAKVAQREGTLDELLADFERRKRENANSVAPLLAIAEIHHVLNQYEERRSALLEASRRRPNDINLLQKIADVEIRAGEFDRAVGLLKDAAKRDTTPGTKEKLANLFLKNGEFQQGLRLLKELPDQSNDPRKIEATVLSLIAKAEWDMAVRHLLEFLPKHPQDWRLKYLQAIALEMDGQEEEAFAIHRSLLETDSEIKGLKSILNNKTYQNSYWTDRMKAPGAMTGWVKLQIMGNIDSSEHRSLQRLRDGYRYSSARNYVNLPGTAEEVRLLSYLKATRLVSTFEEEKREEILANLSVPGVENLKLYKLSKGDRTKYFARIDELLKAEPDNPKFLSLWITYRGNAGEDYQFDHARFRQILASASENNPQSACNLIFGMLHREEIECAEALPHIESLLASAKDEDQRNSLRGYVLYRVQSQIKNKEVEGFEGLIQSLLDEAIAQEKKPKDRVWMDRAFSLALTLDKPDAALTLLNRISGWLREEKISNSLTNHNHYNYRSRSGWGGSGQNSLAPPNFPPTAVKGIPQNIAAMIGAMLNVTQPGEITEAAKRRAELLALLEKPTEEKKEMKVERKESLEVFRERVSEIELPISRALIGAALGDEKALPTFVESVAESTDLDELTLASGYLWREKKFAAAYQVLTRMRMLTLSRAQRVAMDSKLAMAGSILAKKKDLEWDREPAQRAALRLRKSLTNVNERPALMNILIKLGLQEEAEKLGKKTGSNSRSSARRSTRRTGIQKVVDLATDGRKEEAAREAAKLVKSYQKNRNSRYELKRLTDSLGKMDLAEATLAKLNPGDSESISRRLAYANLALNLDQKDLAKPVFESLVKDRPKLSEARIGLTMCLPDEKRSYKEFLNHEEGEFNSQALSTTMASLWQQADDNFEQTLAMFELSQGILENLKPDPDAKRNLSWASYCILRATNDSYYNGVNLLPLFSSRVNRGADKPKSALFDEAAKKVFIAMLRHPQTAEQGFLMLLKAQENLGLKDEEIVAHAKAAVPQLILRKEFVNISGYNQSRRLWSLYRQGGSSSSGSITDVPGPMDYLLTQGSSDEIFTDEVMASLEENQPEKFASLTLARKVGEATPEEALKLFTEWYEKLEKGDEDTDTRKKSPTQLAKELVDLSESLLLFDLKPSTFTDELEARLLKIDPKQWSDNTGFAAFSDKWLRWIARHKDREAVRAFIVKLCEAAMGPQKQWPVLAELGENQLPQDYRSRLYPLANAFSLMCHIEEAILPIVELVIEHDFEKFVPNFHLRNAYYYALQKLNDPEKLTAWMTGTGLFSISTEGDKGAAVVLGLLGSIDYFPNQGGDHTKKIVEAVTKMEINPLLKQLVLARYKGSDEKSKILSKAWEEHIDLLKAMAEKNNTVLAAKLKSWFPDDQAEHLGPNLKGFLTTLREKRLEESRKKAEQWLADGIEIDSNDYEGRQHWSEVLKIAEFDHKLAAQLVIKTLEKVQIDPSLNRSRSSYGGIQVTPIDTWGGQFFEKLFEGNNNVELLDRVRLVNLIYRDDISKQLLAPQSNRNNFSYYLRNKIEQTIRSFTVPKDSPRKQMELAFSAWTKELDATEQSTFISLAVPAILQNWNFNSKEIEGITKWADEELRKESELMADALVVIIQRGGAKYVPDEKETMQKKSKEVFKKLLSSLDLPSPLAVDFSYVVMSSSDGATLFEGAEQWEWLADVLGKHTNGMRNLALSRVLQIFPYLARQEFPGRKEAAKKLMASINGSLITPEFLLKFRNNNSSSHQWIAGLLPLALAAEDTVLAKKLIQQNARSFRGNLGLMMDVAADIDARTAAKLAPATTLPYKTDQLPTFTKDTPAAAAPVIEALPPRDRYRFEVMVASLQDTKEEEKQTEVRRETRLQKLAQRFAKEAPGDKGPRWQLLNLFSSDPESLKILMEEFGKEAAKSNLTTAMTLMHEGGRSESGQALANIIKTWLFAEVDSCRYEAILKEIKLLAKNTSGNNGYYLRQTGFELISKLANHAMLELYFHPEKGAELAALSRENFESSQAFFPSRSTNDKTGVVWMDLFTHVLAGETAAWYEKLKDLPENEQGLFKGPLGEKDRYGLQSITRHDFFQSDDHAKNRIAFLTKIFTDLTFLEKAITHYTHLSTLMDAGIIRQEELYQVIDNLPEDFPRKAEFIMEKAGIIGWRENKVEEAEKLYEEARKLAREKGNEQIVHVINANHARLLGQKERISDSWKYGQLVDPSQLSEWDQKWFSDDMKIWKEAVSKNQIEPDPKLKDESEGNGKKNEEKSATDAPATEQTEQPLTPAE